MGLSTFTVMAGLGGSMGYAMGGLDWGALGSLFGGHVRSVVIGELSGNYILLCRLVFTLVLFIFIGCVTATITSFNEIPLAVLTNPAAKQREESG